MTNELLMILFLGALVLVCVLAVINAREKAKHVAVMAHLKTLVDNWDALRRGDFRILFADETVKAQTERDSRLIAAVETRGHETAAVVTRAMLEEMERTWRRVPHIVGIEGAQQLRIMRRLLGEMFEKQFPPADPNADQYQEKSDALAAAQLKAIMIEAASTSFGHIMETHKLAVVNPLFIAQEIDTALKARLPNRDELRGMFAQGNNPTSTSRKRNRGKRAKART